MRILSSSAHEMITSTKSAILQAQALLFFQPAFGCICAREEEGWSAQGNFFFATSNVLMASQQLTENNSISPSFASFVKEMGAVLSRRFVRYYSDLLFLFFYPVLGHTLFLAILQKELGCGILCYQRKR